MRRSTVNVIDNSGDTVLLYWYDDFGQVNEYIEAGNSLIKEVKFSEQRVAQKDKVVAGVAASAFVIGGIILIAASGGAGAGAVIPAFVLAL